MYDGRTQKDFSKRHPVFDFGCHATATALHPLCCVPLSPTQIDMDFCMSQRVYSVGFYVGEIFDD